MMERNASILKDVEIVDFPEQLVSLFDYLKVLKLLGSWSSSLFC